jgi:hypothetical protein
MKIIEFDIRLNEWDDGVGIMVKPLDKKLATITKSTYKSHGSDTDYYTVRFLDDAVDMYAMLAYHILWPNMKRLNLWTDSVFNDPDPIEIVKWRLK